MTTALQPYIERAGGSRRILILGIGAAAAALIFGVSHWATQPEWVPAYTGVPIETTGQMTDKLDQAGVQYRLEHGGSDIFVAAPELARARVALARGGLPNQGRPGFELFDQPTWGLTDFTQRINYRRALEGELERTVGKMRGIEGAQVHLVLHETEGFGAAEKPAEASVVLKLHGGAEAEKAVITGIAHLIASSVDGLTSDHVTIVDDAGRMLNESDEPTSAENASNKQLQLQRDVEEYLRSKAERLLVQVVGRGNAKVQVNAQINFDHVERRSESVDPDKQAITTETKNEITPGAQGGAAQTNSATTYENARLTETFSGAIGNLKRVTVAVAIAERRDSAPGAKKPTYTPRSPLELEQIASLVRSSIGLDSARGDLLAGVAIPFEDNTPAAVVVPQPTFITTVREMQRPAFGLLGVILMFVIALLGIRALRQPASATADAPLSLPRQESTQLNAYAIDAPSAPIMVHNVTHDRLATSVEQQPDIAARLVRAWIKES